jgi:hypothetical protein
MNKLKEVLSSKDKNKNERSVEFNFFKEAKEQVFSNPDEAAECLKNQTFKVMTELSGTKAEEYMKKMRTSNKTGFFTSADTVDNILLIEKEEIIELSKYWKVNDKKSSVNKKGVSKHFRIKDLGVQFIPSVSYSTERSPKVICMIIDDRLRHNKVIRNLTFNSTLTTYNYISMDYFIPMCDLDCMKMVFYCEDQTVEQGKSYASIKIMCEFEVTNQPQQYEISRSISCVTIPTSFFEAVEDPRQFSSFINNEMKSMIADSRVPKPSYQSLITHEEMSKPVGRDIRVYGYDDKGITLGEVRAARDELSEGNEDDAKKFLPTNSEYKRLGFSNAKSGSRSGVQSSQRQSIIQTMDK